MQTRTKIYLARCLALLLLFLRYLFGKKNNVVVKRSALPALTNRDGSSDPPPLSRYPPSHPGGGSEPGHLLPSAPGWTVSTVSSQSVESET